MAKEPAKDWTDDVVDKTEQLAEQLGRAGLSKFNGWRAKRVRNDPARRLKAAEKARGTAEEEQLALVRTAEATLRTAGDSRLLFEVANVKLWDEGIELPDGNRELTPEVKATVEAAGNFSQKSRATGGRMAGGFLLGGKQGALIAANARKQEDHDLREVYLLIEADTWASTVPVAPEHGLAARQMAQQINVAARNLAAAREGRAERLAAAEEALRLARLDRSVVEAADRELAEARSDLPAELLPPEHH